MGDGGQRHIDAAALNERLAATVPATATTVLQVGRGHGWLAALLKQRHPVPVVYGADSPAPPGTGALDGSFALDPDGGIPTLEPGTVDCIVYADLLGRLADPVDVLRSQRVLLTPSGTITCSVPNLQHHSVVGGLLRGVFPYREGSLLDPSYRRLFTSASAVQLLLDAGYLPDTVGRVEDDEAEPMEEAGAPLFELLGVGAKDAGRDLRTRHLLMRGVPLEDAERAEEVPVTFVACVNDDEQLDANLARSPCLRDDSPHELLVFRGCASAAEGLNAGIERSRNEFVVLVHQDVYLPDGWPARMVAQWRIAQRQGGPIGVGGVFGVADRRVPFDAIGRIVHRDRLLVHGSLPADVDGLDEVLLVVPRASPVRVDAALGWHLYGTDLALQAHDGGMRAVVVDAPCHHNSLTGRVPSKYRESERVLARKWEALLPINTNLSSVGSWLLEASELTDEPGTDTDVAPGQPPAIAQLVTRLRRELAALNAELEQARLQVASMQASPFWRARETYAGIRSRLSRRS